MCPRGGGPGDAGGGEPSALDAVARLGYRGVYWLARAWWWLRRPSTSGALVAFWRGDQVLLVRTSYRRVYSLPGGFLARREPAAAAAAREVLKEVGVTLTPEELTTAWRGTLPFESRADTVTIFECCTDVSAPRIDGREIVWAGWVSLDDARQLPLLPHVAAYLMSRPRRRHAGGARTLAADRTHDGTPG